MAANRITFGPAWLETLLQIYVEVPWRAVYEWAVILVLAFITAVGLLALYPLLYDIAQRAGWL